MHITYLVLFLYNIYNYYIITIIYPLLFLKLFNIILEQIYEYTYRLINNFKNNKK